MGVMTMTVGGISGAGASPFDMVANGVALKSLNVSYSHPSRLQFYVTAPEQSAPIGRFAMVNLYDDGLLLFSGHVITVAPGAHSNQVQYTCFDPTYLAAKWVTLMSLPYVGGAPDPDSVPRLVYNCTNGADEDYAYSVATNTDVAGLITGILNYTKGGLQAIGAAPSIGDPWDGDLSYMTFIAQQKIVWESVTVNNALSQVERLEPRFRRIWNPSTKKWTFYRLTDSPNVTLYLNDSALPATGQNPDYPVIGCEINPAYEDCLTACSIYGPETIGSAVLTSTINTSTWTASGDLTPIGAPVLLENYTDSSGAHTAKFWTKWQIANTSLRRGANLLADWIYPPAAEYAQTPTRNLTVLLSWNGGLNWTACSGVYFDTVNGTLEFIGGRFPFTTLKNDRGQSITAGTTQTIFPPTTIRLYWAPYDLPLKVRYPTSGFAGGAYSDYNIQAEMRIYAEDLAIGREYGVPVTSAYRKGQFETLAQSYWETRCNPFVTGSIVLSGCDYSFVNLNVNVNIADAEGSTTGWEGINAPVTDVEYTFGDQPTTSLTMNGNWLEMYGEDPAAMRERLRITSLQKYTYSQIYGVPVITNYFHTESGMFGDKYKVLDRTDIYNPDIYVDQYGVRQMATIRGGR